VNPFDPEKPYNMAIQGTGVGIVATDGGNVQAAFAKAFAEFGNASPLDADYSITRQIWENLGPQGDEIREQEPGFVWNERSARLLAHENELTGDTSYSKTGELAGNGLDRFGNIVLGSVGRGAVRYVEKPDGTLRVVVITMEGAARDRDGNLLPTVADAQYGAESSSTRDALAIAAGLPGALAEQISTGSK
jgi:hypothetical protein